MRFLRRIIWSIRKSRGHISKVFLRRCGLSPWEIETARLYANDLSSESIAEILKNDIVRQRTQPGNFIGGIFICYDRADLEFAQKLYQHLDEAGASIWMDEQDESDDYNWKRAGRTIRMKDVILMVLSKSSVERKWANNKLEILRKKEKTKNRDVLLSLTLDDSWKEKAENKIIWRQLKQIKVLDFAQWKTEKFEGQFEELLSLLVERM